MTSRRIRLAAIGLAGAIWYAGYTRYARYAGDVSDVAHAPAAPPAAAPLSDAEFWRLVEGFSEPNGYFTSDSLLSNEASFQFVIPRLPATLKPGGAYLGVGPEQNFTYIVALRPAIAF